MNIVDELKQYAVGDAKPQPAPIAESSAEPEAAPVTDPEQELDRLRAARLYPFADMSTEPHGGLSDGHIMGLAALVLGALLLIEASTHDDGSAWQGLWMCFVILVYFTWPALILAAAYWMYAIYEDYEAPPDVPRILEERKLRDLFLRRQAEQRAERRAEQAKFEADRRRREEEYEAGITARLAAERSEQERLQRESRQNYY